MRTSPLIASIFAALLIGPTLLPAQDARALKFTAQSPAQALTWQRTARQTLYRLMMGGSEPERCPLQPEVIRRIDVPDEGYVLEEMTLQTLPDRRAHAWVARPPQPVGKSARFSPLMATAAAASRSCAVPDFIGTAASSPAGLRRHCAGRGPA